MIMRIRQILISVLAVTTVSITAAIGQPLVTLNYEDAELPVVAAEVAERTGFQLVLDPRLSGRANIVSPPDMGLTPQQVWEVFLATLQVNNFTAVPAGDRVYKIVPIEQGARDASPVNASDCLRLWSHGSLRSSILRRGLRRVPSED